MFGSYQVTFGPYQITFGPCQDNYGPYFGTFMPYYQGGFPERVQMRPKHMCGCNGVYFGTDWLVAVLHPARCGPGACPGRQCSRPLEGSGSQRKGRSQQLTKIKTIFVTIKMKCFLNQWSDKKTNASILLRQVSGIKSLSWNLLRYHSMRWHVL